MAWHATRQDEQALHAGVAPPPAGSSPPSSGSSSLRAPVPPVRFPALGRRMAPQARYPRPIGVVRPIEAVTAGTDHRPMPDPVAPTSPVPTSVDPAPARRSAAQARTSMPVWVALVLLVACVLAANLAASVFGSSGDGVEQAPGRPDAGVDHPARDAG